MSYLQHILIHHPTVFYAICSVFCKMQESGSGLLHLLLVTSLYTSTIKWCNIYEKHCWIICSTSPNQTVVSVQQFNHECFKKILMTSLVKPAQNFDITFVPLYCPLLYVSFYFTFVSCWFSSKLCFMEFCNHIYGRFQGYYQIVSIVPVNLMFLFRKVWSSFHLWWKFRLQKSVPV